jgi:hypothetical protein
VCGDSFESNQVDRKTVARTIEALKEVPVPVYLLPSIKDAEILIIKKFMVPFDIITMTPEEFESDSSLVGLYASEGKVVYG